MDRSTSSALRPVVRWLIAGLVLIACMVIIGGITRLTGSGLSITEWQPIMGALPPLNEQEWQVAFDKYKQIPEYTLKNQHMDMGGFKGIFFWEYLHRNWGRLMGLVFILPFALFLKRGVLRGWLRTRAIAILIAGATVAALGWFMVASGLQDNPDVSHYRLAIHLTAAFSVFSLVLWTVLDIRSGRRTFGGDGTAVGMQARWLLALVLLQIVWGAFTAGLDAGRIYNTWPLMNGSLMPENVTAFGNWWFDLSHHRDGVQFVHRNLAWVVAGAVVAFALMNRTSQVLAGSWELLVGLVVLQFSLGVFTILTQVNIILGVAHQFGALLLLSTVIVVVHRSGRALNATAA